jgi:hypothetical protein
MRRLATLMAVAMFALPAATITPEAALAGDGSQMIACRANSADVSGVAVQNLRFGIEASYAWASATVALNMRNGTTRSYFLSGRAEPTDKLLRPNNASAGFSYPGFTCTVQYPGIASVRNCAGAKKQRRCEIGVTVFGMPMVYAVSMTAERAMVEAAAAR